MMVLALELSTSTGSLALLDGDTVLRDCSWREERRRSRTLFDRLAEVPDLAAIDLVAVGTGPGNYSGLRTAVAAAQALALPGGTALHFLPSGDALAAEQAPVGRAVVVGDARRDRLWTGWFQYGEREEEWALTDWEHLRPRLDQDLRMLSPDADRLAAAAAALDLPTTWPIRNDIPTAVGVGRAALDRIARGMSSDPPLPLYLQPAV